MSANIKSAPTASASAPSAPKKVKGTYGGTSGRKVTDNKSNDIPNAGAGTLNQKEEDGQISRINRDETDIVDLERLLDNDNVALLNMKRDVTESQQKEINRFRDDFNRVMREYDGYLIQNNIREKQLLEIAGKIKMLLGVGDANVETGMKAQEYLEFLQKQLVDAEEHLAMEQRANKMLTAMCNRLDNETNDCRVEASQVILSMEQCKFDFTNADSILRLSKSELLEQEKIMDGLQKTMRARKNQRKAKLQIIKNLVVDGEHSLQQVNELVTSTSPPNNGGKGGDNISPNLVPDDPKNSKKYNMDNNTSISSTNGLESSDRYPSKVIRNSVHSPRNRMATVRAMFKGDRKLKTSKDGFDVHSSSMTDLEFAKRRGLTVEQVSN